jgi:hypothetical protein
MKNLTLFSKRERERERERESTKLQPSLMTVFTEKPKSFCNKSNDKNKSSNTDRASRRTAAKYAKNFVTEKYAIQMASKKGSSVYNKI